MEHLSEEVLEQYALGRLSEADAAPLEEHLLICEECRSRLQETDEYVEAMCKALTELEKEPLREHPKTHPKLFKLSGMLTMPRAVAALAAAALVMIVLPFWRGGTGPYELRLVSYRGAEQTLMPTAPAGEMLRLSVDLTGLAGRPAYVVEIVNARGTAVWESTVPGSGAEATVEVDRALTAGQYWTRVYEQPVSGVGRGDLLREFGLRIE